MLIYKQLKISILDENFVDFRSSVDDLPVEYF